MNFEEWLAKNEKQLGSPYEKIFVIKVLANIVDIDFTAIRPQFGFKDTDGKARYCDFVLQEGKTVKIAIEIDGVFCDLPIRMYEITQSFVVSILNCCCEESVKIALILMI